jgi:hypothetical protein
VWGGGAAWGTSSATHRTHTCGGGSRLHVQQLTVAAMVSNKEYAVAGAVHVDDAAGERRRDCCHRVRRGVEQPQLQPRLLPQQQVWTVSRRRHPPRIAELCSIYARHARHTNKAHRRRSTGASHTRSAHATHPHDTHNAHGQHAQHPSTTAQRTRTAHAQHTP